MKSASLLALLVVAYASNGCSFENSSTLLTPTAPGGIGEVAGSTAPTGSNGGNSTSSTPASAFSGTWGSSSSAGLPLGTCVDLKWLITEQSASSVGGTVTANCQNDTTVSAHLTGVLKNENVIDLRATGNLVALGVPCAFDLKGTGTRQTNDTMKLEYTGTYCLGNLSGTENLKRFPSVP